MARLSAAMRIAPDLPTDSPRRPARSLYVLLINPFYPKDANGSFGKHVLTPTLALTSVAASTPVNWEVQIWDENLLQGPPPTDPMPQVVGITVHLTFAQRAFELARFYRERGAKVIMGGLHVMSCPQEVVPHADAIVTGDGTVVWPSILNDIQHGRLKPRYDAGFSAPFRENPRPRRSLLPRSSFLTTTSLIATRGCHNRCGFCYLSTCGMHMPYQTLDVDDVAAQFAADHQPYGVFTDNNLGSNRTYLRKLCDALAPLNKIWSAALSIDVTDDPELIRSMALAGCTGVFIGFETLNDTNLRSAGKRSPKPDDYARRVKLLHDCGIAVNGSFVFGFDGDSPDVFQTTADWIEATRLECATFHILTPYPGTALFEEFDRQGRLLHKDWNRYDTAHVVFQPRRMTAGQLQEGYEWTYRRLFSYASIWRRRPASLSAMPGYLVGACLYKKCNWLWPILIRHRLTSRVWRPMIELSRWRHVHWRKRLARDLPAPLPCT